VAQGGMGLLASQDPCRVLVAAEEVPGPLARRTACTVRADSTVARVFAIAQRTPAYHSSIIASPKDGAVVHRQIAAR
jgi:hypothetical protein